MQAMIFAAGLGTRLKPLTDTMPKALVRVGGEPLIKIVLDKLRKAGAGRIVVNVHHFANQIIEYLAENNNFGMDIHISIESEFLLDTGGGIRKALPLFIPHMPILIHNVDILSNVSLEDFYKSSNGHTATLLVSERKTKRYLLFDDDMKLKGWTNIETGEVKSPYGNINPKDYNMFAFSGIHVLREDAFPFMSDFPDKFGIMDFYLRMCDKIDIQGVFKKDLQLLDVGKLDTLKEAELFVKKQNENKFIQNP